MAQTQLPAGAVVDANPVPASQTTSEPAQPSAPSGLPAGATVDAQPTTPAAQPKSLGQEVSNLGEEFVNTLPGIGLIHQAAGAAQDWASKEMAKPSTQISPAKTFGAGVVRDTAGLVHGATSPEGLAISAAATAAPEIVGPLMIAHGLYTGAKGWGDLRNPDVLQHELNSAAEVAGGAAATDEGWKGVQQASRYKAGEEGPTEQYQDFKKAVPPSKSAPYQPEDYAAARPYIANAAKGETPLNIEGARNAADDSISSIEAKIDHTVKQISPDVTLNGREIIDKVRNQLRGNVRVDFYNAGLQELEKYPLGWERGVDTDGNPDVDPPLTLERADDIRHQLNAENRAYQKANNYDLATAYATNPAFAARAAASEALRDGIYDYLEGSKTLPDARQLRLDEGSLIKVRNALQDKIYQSDRPVKTSRVGSLKRMGQRVSQVAGTLGGYAVGKSMGHPIIGIGVGEEAGRIAAEHLIPLDMTRDELVQRSFESPTAPRVAPRIGPSAARAGIGVIAGQAAGPENRTFFRASDGSIHSVPSDQIHAALQIDPYLKILELQDR